MKSMLFAVGFAAIVAVAAFASAEQAIACGGGCCARPTVATARSNGCCARPAVSAAVPTASCHVVSNINGQPVAAAHAEHAMAEDKPTAAAKDVPAAKEVSLTGTLVCAKCTLKETKQCQTAIVVKEGEKNVTYYLLDKGNGESYHEKVCGGGKEPGMVSGKAFEKDGKMWITPTKVTYTK